MPATLAAARTWAAPPLSRPRAMFSAIDREKRNPSCGTYPRPARRDASGISVTSRPSTRSVPTGGSQSRASRSPSVDLPLPVGPTTATFSPGTTSKLTSRSAGARSPYANVRWEKRRLGAAGSTGGVSEPGRAAVRPPSEDTGLTDPATTEPGCACVRPPSEDNGLTDPITTEPGCAGVRPPSEDTGLTDPATTEPGRAAVRPPSEDAGLTDPATTEPGRAAVRPPSEDTGLTDPATTISWMRFIEVRPRRTIESVQPRAIVGQVRYAR